jgi:hypothetical protein
MKVYGSVLLNRFKGFCEDRGLLVDEQFGFREKRGRRDALFVFNSVVEERKRKGLYAGFLDIKKAYPSVRRKGLWWKLWKMGIRGRFWRAVRSLYEVMESCVSGDDCGFEFLLGLRQGCVLSPLLFALFVNGLVDEVKQEVRGVMLGDLEVWIVLFADDIVLLCEDKWEMQKALDVCSRYAKRWGFVWNCGKDKSEMVIFGKGPGVEWEWTLGGRGWG